VSVVFVLTKRLPVVRGQDDLHVVESGISERMPLKRRANSSGERGSREFKKSKSRRPPASWRTRSASSVIRSACR